MRPVTEQENKQPYIERAQKIISQIKTNLILKILLQVNAYTMNFKFTC